MRLTLATAPASLPVTYAHWTYGETLWVQRTTDDDRHSFDLLNAADRAVLFGAGIARPVVYRVTAEDTPVQLRLLHGRATPETSMDDWGEDGAVLAAREVIFAPDRVTVCGPDGAVTVLRVVGDCLQHAGRYYGDAEVQPAA